MALVGTIVYVLLWIWVVVGGIGGAWELVRKKLDDEQV
jgi:hypothetical protein